MLVFLGTKLNNSVLNNTIQTHTILKHAIQQKKHNAQTTPYKNTLSNTHYKTSKHQYTQSKKHNIKTTHTILNNSVLKHTIQSHFNTTQNKTKNTISPQTRNNKRNAFSNTQYKKTKTNEMPKKHNTKTKKENRIQQHTLLHNRVFSLKNGNTTQNTILKHAIQQQRNTKQKAIQTNTVSKAHY